MDNERAPGYWMILAGIPSLLALFFVLHVPMNAPLPIYFLDAQQYASTGYITDTSYPVAFTWLTGLSLKAFGTHGPEVLQVTLYLLIVLSVWALARKSGASPRYALIAGVVAAIYPQLPASVTKIWDVELSVLLLVLVMLCTVSLMREGLRPVWVIATGVVLGLSFAQRPNMLLLIPLPIYFCFTSAASWRRKIVALAGAGVLCAGVLAGINTLAHGSFFLAQNGPYNLVQGHNEYTAEVLLKDLSCERTVALFMIQDGMEDYLVDISDPRLQEYWTHRAFAFMRAHPQEEPKIAMVKLWTVFRPNTRNHPAMSVYGVPTILESLIFPAWLILLVLRKVRSGLDRLDWTFIVMVALFVLPFLITSSDPRYQIPIEICLLSHIAYMLDSGSKIKAAMGRAPLDRADVDVGLAR